jgi:hypothetical protein
MTDQITITDATRGLWFAIAADYNGEILNPDEMKHRADMCVYIMVGRGSAEPDGNRMREMAGSNDVLYEVDLTGEPEGRAETCWAQAQFAAAAMNAAQAVAR